MVAFHLILLLLSLYATILWFVVARRARKKNLHAESTLLSMLIVMSVILFSEQALYFWQTGQQLQYVSWERLASFREYMDHSQEVLHCIFGMVALFSGAKVRQYVQKKLKQDAGNDVRSPDTT